MTEDGRRKKSKPTKGFKEFQKKKAKRERELTSEEEELRRIRKAEMQKVQGTRGENSEILSSGEQTRRREEKKENTKRNKSKKGISIFKKVITSILCILALLIVVVGYNIISFLSQINDNDMIAPLEVSSGESVNILMLGMDIGDPNQVENKSIKRTDTIMVFNYHPKTKKANLVSVPRDMLIKTQNGNNAKINAAYSIGGEQYIKEQVESFLSVKMNYMVKIDYQAFRDFIDAIGGIEMHIERDMYYDDDSQNLHINFKGGETRLLNGKEAEEFFRWRKNNDGTGLANGDLDRIKNQQLFMQKVIEKCAKPSTILKMNKILKSVGQNIETNMSTSKMLSLAFKLTSLNVSDVNMVTLTGEPRKIDKQDYLVYDRKANAEIINSLKNPGSSLTDIKKENISIMILNATKINGLASSYELNLRNLGYDKIDVGNIDLRDKSVIMVNDENIKNMIKGNFPDIKKYDEKDPKVGYDQYDVIVILGKDAKNF
ncbi:MAG: LCP family protein [Clostridium sp.]